MPMEGHPRFPIMALLGQTNGKKAGTSAVQSQGQLGGKQQDGPDELQSFQTHEPTDVWLT